MVGAECRCERRHGAMESGHLDLSHAWAIGGKLEDNGLAGWG